LWAVGIPQWGFDWLFRLLANTLTPDELCNGGYPLIFQFDYYKRYFRWIAGYWSIEPSSRTVFEI
jgi:hypothetical protein